MRVQFAAMQYLPNRLKEARIKAELSQADMANYMGVSTNTIYRIERSLAQDIKLGFIQEYARITGTSAEFLIFGDQYLSYYLRRFDEAKEIIERTLNKARAIIVAEREKYLDKN